ncbi:M28 family peptidase [Schnuerera ultunensis]|uniref:M28 family peptidase n=1 Tax=Schnuerera ultunensis TaxID=45497 RepID=UPI0003FF8887|nr:M28 family peptidase [Schnuerera ultunensis]
MTKPNWILIIGSIIILLLLFVIIYEDSLITADPYSLDRGLEYRIGNDVLKVEHPIKPNSVDKLGTDPLGRNLLSLLIKGTKITVGIAFISTIIRLAIGILISLFIKDKKKRVNSGIYYILTIILNIFIGYMIFTQPFFKELELSHSILASGVILGIFGWGRIIISLNCRNSVYGTRNGKEIKVYLKEKAPYILINFFMEMGTTLFILLILGFLGITIGVNKYSTINTNWGIMPNYNPEWGGILAIARQAIELEAYWLIVGPLFFFIISILGFLLVGKGLSQNIEKYGTIVSKRMVKIGNFISPKQYVEDIKRFSWNKARVIVKTAIIIFIILWIAPSINTGNGYYQIDKERVWKDLKNIYEIQQINGINSIESKDRVGEYIAEELEKIYRLLPVFEDEYVQEINYEQEDLETKEKAVVKGRNIAAYIWGRNSNNPLVIVTDYGNELHRNGTSVAATLELARSLGEKNNKEMASRTIVFLFIDGNLDEGMGVYNALGSKNIDINSFYIYLNYLGLGDSNKIYIDTSSVLSAYKRHYRNIRNIKEGAKELKITIEQEYFNNMFIDIEAFTENKVSGLALSGIGKEGYEQYTKFNEQNRNDISKIHSNTLEEQVQLIMNIAIKYAWSDKPRLGDSY